ncbi:MAG: amino acid ABC transporter substrate-binding protein [Candidatus Bathyarchaeia archaeon]
MLSRKAITKVQAAVIAVVVIIAVILGALAYTMMAPPATPTPATPTPATPTPATPTPATPTPATPTPLTPTPATPTPATPTPATPPISEIRYGPVQQLSGPLAMLGYYGLLGIQICVQWINDHGGINFKGFKVPVKLIYYDCESDLQYAIRLAEKLIVEDKVNFFNPPWTPEFVLATVPVAEKYKIVSISPGGGADVEYQQGFKYMIQFGIHGTTHFQYALKMIHELDPSAKRVAFFQSDADPGVFRTSVYNASKKYGFEIVYDKTYPEGITDASTMLREVAALKPDVLVGGTFPASGMLIARQIIELRIYVKWMMLDMVVNKVDFGQAFGKYAVGFLLDSPYEPEGKWEVYAAREGKEYIGPTNDEILEYWRKMGREERIRTETGMGVTGPAIMKKCVELAQSLDSDKVIAAALSLDVYTCKGRLKLDPQNPAHQIGLGGNPIVMQWQKAGNKLVYAIVYPSEFANALLVPMPTWEEKDSWPVLELAVK